MGWELTRGLQNLRAQVNQRWPGRDKTSDGTIGNEAHQAETSGHNPDDTAGARPAWNGDPDTVPEVRAWDMDNDLGEPGTTAQDLVDHLRRLPGLSSVIRYMIYNRTMYHSRDGFAATAYTGDSPHTEHIHFEGAWAQAADDNTTFDYELEKVGDVTPKELLDYDDVANAYGDKATNPKVTVRTALSAAVAGHVVVRDLPARLDAIDAKLSTVPPAAAVALDDGQLQTLIAQLTPLLTASLAPILADAVIGKLTTDVELGFRPAA